MNGYRLPYSWSKRIHDGRKNTYVLLDAASYLTSGRLDLTNDSAAPDFIALSFYKIFGFPDLGALIVRKSAQEVLSRRRYFGGGTVEQVTVIDKPFHAMKSNTIHDFLEDGTLPFHNIVALTHAIAIHERIFGPAKSISIHTAHISAWLYQQLSSLKHANGRHVMEMHKDENATHGDPETQGPIIAFSLRRSDGAYIGSSHFERLAIDCGFQIRTGGVCNPGGIASMLSLESWELRRNFTEGLLCGGDIDVIGAKPTGIIRISLGPMSTMSDVKRFANFVAQFFIDQTLPPCTVVDQTPKTISAIAGCGSMSVLEEEYAAYKVWDQQWCIVDSTSGMPIYQGLERLTSSIEPEHGILRLHHNANTFDLSLWDVPRPADSSLSDANVRRFDLYIDSKLNTWLSDNLGVSCSLARYRREDINLSPEASTCVVPSCEVRFECKSALFLHYKTHADDFLRTHPFGSQRKKSIFHSWRNNLMNRNSNRSTVTLPQLRTRQASESVKAPAILESRKTRNPSQATILSPVETRIESQGKPETAMESPIETRKLECPLGGEIVVFSTTSKSISHKHSEIPMIGPEEHGTRSKPPSNKVASMAEMFQTTGKEKQGRKKHRMGLMEKVLGS